MSSCAAVRVPSPPGTPSTTRERLPLLLLITALVAYRPFYDVVPRVFDEWLALPIARAVADPGLYPAGDLIVSAGLAGPFWLYRLAGELLRMGARPEVLWAVGFFACEGALFYAVWRLLRALRIAPVAATVALVLFAASPAYRGTLNWTQLPFFAFVTASVAVPLLLFAAAAAIEGAATWAFVLAAIAFDLHPGAGVLAVATVVTALLASTPRASWRRLAGAAAVGAAIAAPNLVAIARHGVGDAATRAGMMALFPYFAVHVNPRVYWREGYAFFSLLLAAGVWGSAALPARERRIVRAVVASMLGLIGVYALNAETVRVLPVVLLFLYRATWVLKPVLFGCAGAGVLAWHVEGARWSPGGRRALMLVLVAAACVQYDALADALAAIAIGVLLLAAAPRVVARAAGVLLVTTGLLLGAAALGSRDTLAGACQLAVIAIGLGLALAPRMLPALGPAAPDAAAPLRPLRPRAAFATLALVLVLPLALPSDTGMSHRPWSPRVVLSRFRFLHPAPSVAGVYRWITDSTARGALIATPIDDRRFLPFRALTQRGQYVTTSDINQLAYDPPSYVRAGQRLRALGARIEAYDASGYARLSDDALRAIAADGVTHIILSAAAAAQPRAFPALYRDSSWVVLALSPQASRSTP